MNLLSGTATKTYSLLSIGQRGVGKTVFLTGSYAELHGDSQPDHLRQLWFDCQDSDAQENIESLLSYIARTGQYPSPTLKITNFNFSLKRHTLWGAQTLSHFRWWEIPGEICNNRNRDFQTIVLNSHGCCVFIDAYALVHNNAYIHALEDIINKVMGIASLVSLNRLNYGFALILTKCDLLEPGSASFQQIENGLQPLATQLDAVKVNYKTFYSCIPIVRTEGASTLRPKGAAAPLLWLAWELRKAYNPGLMNNLLNLVARTPLNGFPPGFEGADGSLHSLFKKADKAFRVKKIFGLYLFPATRKYILLLAMATLGSVGALGLFGVNYEWVFQRQSKNLDALSNLDTLRLRGQFDQAIPLTEKLIQQEPERLELRLQLARLYELTGQVSKAETSYDLVLARQKNNLKALVGKAVLRKAHGDTKTAEALFAQAEKAAPAKLKQQVRLVAQETLKEPTQPIIPPK